ncbi:MAG: hypothetical protein WCG42_00750 [Parachlamydiaceae bacterium]
MRMSLLLFFLLPFVTAVISSFAVAFCLWLFVSMKKGFFQKKFEESSLVQQGEELINRRLDAVIIAFKEQIPIVTMFLSQSKEEALKECAKKELYRLIPECQQFIVPVFGRALLTQCKFQIVGTAFLVGLVLGVIESLVLFFLS